MAILAAAYACDLPTAPPFPEDAIPLTVPAEYSTWWQVTASCARLSGDFERVQWYVVPGSRSITYRGSDYQGLWYRQGNRIVLAEQSVMRGALVRHEMLHALLGRGSHPHEYYRERCGGVVVCAGECEDETRAPAAESTVLPRMLATELELEMELVSSPATRENGERWVGVVVSARNPHDERRMVRLGGSGDRPPLPTFGYGLASPGSPARDAWEFVSDTALVFEAGETRRRLFDVWLSPRDWEIRGRFAGGETTPVKFDNGS